MPVKISSPFLCCLCIFSLTLHTWFLVPPSLLIHRTGGDNGKQSLLRSWKQWSCISMMPCSSQLAQCHSRVNELGRSATVLIPRLGVLCRFMPWSAPGCFPEGYSEGWHGGKMRWRGRDSALCRESLPPSRLFISPLFSCLVLHLNRASACKVRAPQLWRTKSLLLPTSWAAAGCEQECVSCHFCWRGCESRGRARTQAAATLGRLPGQECYSFPGSRRASSRSRLPPVQGVLPEQGFIRAPQNWCWGELGQAALLHLAFGMVSCSYLQVGLRVKPHCLSPLYHAGFVIRTDFSFDECQHVAAWHAGSSGQGKAGKWQATGKRRMESKHIPLQEIQKGFRYSYQVDEK